MRDGGGDERPRGGGEAAAAVEVVFRRRQGEQVVNVEDEPEIVGKQLNTGVCTPHYLRH